ncbi:hypothetical protein BAMA_24710 [Bacillus manliponensis]|uniref:DUF4257 domain-containing protein n=1 Tax=Bacillus manliponensis TaxID=574376 RepID=A0A073KA73_9BACI|nr:DUF4257 domain-containing protein [Bacillus manliponensis]KEK19198.1 hypothetical protein BAMA_24710 [Bacillus manliponensis]
MLNVILTSVIVGMISGFVSHYMTNKKIVMPRKTKLYFHPGFLGEMFVGSLAAIVGVAILGPQETLDVIKVSILAGISGQTFLLQERINAEEQKVVQQQRIDEIVKYIEDKDKK